MSWHIQWAKYPDQLAERYWKIRISSHNSRARQRGYVGTISLEDWFAVLAAYGGVCCVCGGDEYIQIEHIVALTEGGTNTKDNIRPMCRYCHLEKTAKETSRRMKQYHADRKLDILALDSPER